MTNSVSLGLLLHSLDDALNRIMLNPGIYREADTRVRKFKLKTFPYTVVFRVRRCAIEIIARMHLRREPGFWKNRI